MTPEPLSAVAAETVRVALPVALVVGGVGLVALVVAGLAMLLVGRVRRSRTHDMRVLAGVGAALGRYRTPPADAGVDPVTSGVADRPGASGTRGSPEPEADSDADPWCGVVHALRERLDASRVIVVLDGQVVRSSPGGVSVPGELVAGHGDRPTDLTAHVPADRAAVVWTARSAPAAARPALIERGVAEIVVVPLHNGGTPVGVLEVHDPARSWWARGFRPGRVPMGSTLLGSTLLRWSAFGDELALLATVGRQLSASVATARLEDRLRSDARHDPLTGLLNRTGFLEAAARALTDGGGVAVIDFSLLDQVTDALGHARGERLVGLVAARLAAADREPHAAGRTDTPSELPAGTGPSNSEPGRAIVARLEGDTFAVVVSEADPAAAHRAAERLRERLMVPYVVEGLPFTAPVRVGVAVDHPWASLGPAGPTRVAALLRRADVALSDARHDAPSVRCYEPSMGERAARRLALIREFPGAVADGQVRVHYQPTVALSGPSAGTVLGVEALARWRHPELGELLPDEFVPVLEATGQIGALTRFVLDEALAAARGWLDAGLRLSVAVNLSVGNLGDETFPDEVAERLCRHRVPAELLILELTESGVSSERDVALPVLRRLHAMGCRLAVDDFGTGQSSLANLRRLPVDQVKIDKSFVLTMGTESGDVAVVRAIVEMGHTLGLTVVAEGVEQTAVRMALQEMGCDVAQGYLVSRPLSAGALELWLGTLAAAPAVPGAENGPLALIA